VTDAEADRSFLHRGVDCDDLEAVLESVTADRDDLRRCFRNAHAVSTTSANSSCTSRRSANGNGAAVRRSDLARSE
jgi:hypothetical protein